MSFEVHREPLYRRYYASYTSGAFCYAIVFAFVLVFLPLIIAYNSSSFWIKDSILYEQPLITYKYQAIVQVFGKSSDTNAPMSLYYSTSSILNQQHSSHLRIPVMQTAELDDNNDGLVDRLEVALTVPLGIYEQVTGMSCLFLHDVKLQTRARYVFDSASLVTFEGGSPISQLRIDGDVLLHQTWPLMVKGGFRVPYSGDSLLSITKGMSELDGSQSAIMSKMAARNLSTIFHPNFQLADRQPQPPPADHSVRYFNASITMRIPNQPIRYTPSVSEVLKYAWIQYIAFFAVVSFLLFRLTSFVFRHQLLYTFSVADVVTEKMD